MVSAMLDPSQADLLVCFERYTSRGLLWKTAIQAIVNLQHPGWRGEPPTVLGPACLPTGLRVQKNSNSSSGLDSLTLLLDA